MSWLSLGRRLLKLAAAAQARDCQGEAPVLTLIGLAIASASLIATLLTVPEFRDKFFTASEVKPSLGSAQPGSSTQASTIPKSVPSSVPPSQPTAPIRETILPNLPPLPPQAAGSSNASRPFGAASKSWCLGMKGQWKFRQEHFQTNDESIKAAMEEKDCGYWDVRAE